MITAVISGSQLLRKCGSLDFLQPYCRSRPVTETVLPYYYRFVNSVNTFLPKIGRIIFPFVEIQTEYKCGRCFQTPFQWYLNSWVLPECWSVSFCEWSLNYIVYVESCLMWMQPKYDNMEMCRTICSVETNSVLSWIWKSDLNFLSPFTLNRARTGSG
jgi:hypothetical protein